VLLGVVALIAVQRGVVNSTTLLLIAVVVPSIILHEVSHGAVALLFGDDTARRAGRLTLNPIKHIDPFGTLILPAILALSGFGVFGYAIPATTGWWSAWPVRS
jgi:Zn-dependent protease